MSRDAVAALLRKLSKARQGEFKRSIQTKRFSSVRAAFVDMEPNMDVDLGVSQCDERSPAVEKEKYEEKRGFLSSLEAGSEAEGASVASDLYHLDFTVALTETESGEVDSEFIDALTEIEGKKSFPCSVCDKICKSKGGLTKHTNSRHRSETDQACETHLCKDTVSSIVESIKTNLIEENLYGAEINASLTTVSSSEALFAALLPLYETFCRKTNQDKLLESFYGLIPRSCELLNCQDFRAANLIMIHLPDHLVGFYNVDQTRQAQETTVESVVQIDPAERGPLSYIGGYVISKLFQINKRKTGQQNEELQALLHNMKASDQSSNSFISARTRGGLVTPCEDLVGILEAAEIYFRKEVDKTNLTLRNIPTEIICISTLRSPVVKSLWDNIVLASGVDAAGHTQKLCLENVIKLYLKVRSFSYARDYITKYKIKEKQTKKKALRKDMKQSSSDKA